MFICIYIYTYLNLYIIFILYVHATKKYIGCVSVKLLLFKIHHMLPQYHAQSKKCAGRLMSAYLLL